MAKLKAIETPAPPDDRPIGEIWIEYKRTDRSLVRVSALWRSTRLILKSSITKKPAHCRRYSPRGMKTMMWMLTKKSKMLLSLKTRR